MTSEISSFLSPKLLGGGNSNATEFNLNVNSTDSTTAVDISEVVTSRSAGAALSASQATAAARIAESATSSILSLRKEQYTLAKQAETELDSGKRSDIATEIATIQTEIETIATQALDSAGNNVLSGQTIEIDEYNQVELGNYSFLDDDPSISLTTLGNAETASTTLNTEVLKASSAASATSAATNKAEGILSDILAGEEVIRESDPTKVSTLNEASDLSKEIAKQLRNFLSDSGVTELNNELLLTRGPLLLS